MLTNYQANVKALSILNYKVKEFKKSNKHLKGF